MIIQTFAVHCDATNRSPLCMGATIPADTPSEATELARISGWLRLAPDGPNDPITHLCSVCQTGPR